MNRGFKNVKSGAGSLSQRKWADLLKKRENPE